ncbi:MAG: methyltransferase domain-containing protein [Clostridiales bacterium]|nr:methyltransferase domain-containing protein [Clostridiales bacterium]
MNIYLYIINYPVYEKELCELEMKSLFGEIPKKKYFYSHIYVDPSRSPFIKELIKIISIEENFSTIVSKISKEKLHYNEFRVNYVKLEQDKCTYEERLNSMREIGYAIVGEPNIHNPKNILAITKENGKWIFGEYERNNYKWHIHQNKPNNYSNSLGIRVARALINIAVENKKKLSLIDPCCGVGTVVIEGLSMGETIKGIDINKSIVSKARRNLEFFGYDIDSVKQGSIHDISCKYDVAIVDLPYGLFTPISVQEQINIINSARRIALKLILISFEDMDEIIKSAGFNIVNECTVSKGKFIRKVQVCI